MGAGDNDLALPPTSGIADDATAQLPAGEVPPISPLARVAAGRPRPPSIAPVPSLTTAADALRDEEVERTRLFIRMGWLLSVIVMLTFPFVDAPPAMSAVFGAGLVIGMIISFFYHRAFADPRRYTERALLALSVVCVI